MFAILISVMFFGATTVDGALLVDEPNEVDALVRFYLNQGKTKFAVISDLGSTSTALSNSLTNANMAPCSFT